MTESKRSDLEARLLHRIAALGVPMGNGRANPDNDMIYLLMDCHDVIHARFGAQEPVAWIDFTDAGRIRFWTNDRARAEREIAAGRHLRAFSLAELVSLAARAGDDLRVAMREACDLLAERKHGSPARSPGHNARLVLESALARDPGGETKSSDGGVESRRHAKTGNKSGAAPEAEQSSSASSFVRASEEGLTSQARAGVAPGPSEATQPELEAVTADELAEFLDDNGMLSSPDGEIHIAGRILSRFDVRRR